MTPPLRLNLLGGFEAVRPGLDGMKISTKKNQGLLAYLAMNLGKPCTRERIIELLWSERAHSHARDSLRQSLLMLRRDLETIAPSPLVIEGETLALDGAAVAVDVAEFSALSGSTEHDDLRCASELYRGDFLEGLAVRDPAFDLWAGRERMRLQDQALAALGKLIPLLEGPAAIAAARRLVALDPMREGSNLALIRAYAEQGQSEMAVRQQRDYRALLKRELREAPTAAFESEIAALLEKPAPRQPPEIGGKAARPRATDSDKAVIAVLAFEARSAGAETRFLAEALTDNVVTAISRVTLFRVVTQSSVQTQLGAAGDFRKLAFELGADYVLEGGVQRSDRRVRLNTRLIDAAAGHHLWADRYDCEVADLMDVQDLLARSVAASIETQIYLAKRNEYGASSLEDATARDLIMCCRGLLYDMSDEAFDKVTRLATRAIELEPRNGRAWLARAEAHLHQLSMGLIPHDEANVARGLELTQTALSLSPDDEWAHFFMSKALTEAGRLEEAPGEAERALEINPSLSAAIAQLGEIDALLGRPETAIEQSRSALRLNPRNPTNFWRHSILALAHFVAGEHEVMLQEASRVHNWRPDFPRGPLLMAAALAALDRPAEARAAIAAALALRPKLDLESVVPRFLPRYARDADHARMIEMLRAAGLPGAA